MEAAFRFVVASAVFLGTQDSGIDAIGKRLAAAKATYEKDEAKFRKDAGAYLDGRAKAARRTGDRDSVKRIEEQRKIVDAGGEAPASLPSTLKKRIAAARAAMDAAYSEAIRKYTQAGEDGLAAATEKELKAFREKGDPRALPVEKALLGVWRIRMGDWQADWTFAEDKSIRSTNGTWRGKPDKDVVGRWTVELEQKRVLVTWSTGQQDCFDLPLGANSATGSQVDRDKTRLEARKVEDGRLRN